MESVSFFVSHTFTVIVIESLLFLTRHTPSGSHRKLPFKEKRGRSRKEQNSKEHKTEWNNRSLNKELRISLKCNIGTPSAFFTWCTSFLCFQRYLQMVDWRGESTLASHVSLVQKNYPQTLFDEKHCSSYRPWQRINHLSLTMKKWSTLQNSGKHELGELLVITYQASWNFPNNKRHFCLLLILPLSLFALVCLSLFALAVVCS